MNDNYTVLLALAIIIALPLWLLLRHGKDAYGRRRPVGAFIACIAVILLIGLLYEFLQCEYFNWLPDFSVIPQSYSPFCPELPEAMWNP